MRLTPLSIPAVLRIDLELKSDDRGFLARWFCGDTLRGHGVDFRLSQANHTLTRKRGTIRGLHFQRPPMAEQKIVRCIRGTVMDVAVDVRQGSATFGHHCCMELSESNRSMILIPAGFAHGFQTLEDDVELLYLHSCSYSPSHEGGVDAFDPHISIPWPQPVAERSDRDRQLPSLHLLEPIQL